MAASCDSTATHGIRRSIVPDSAHLALNGRGFDSRRRHHFSFVSQGFLAPESGNRQATDKLVVLWSPSTRPEDLHKGAPPLWQRFLGAAPPTGDLYHADDRTRSARLNQEQVSRLLSHSGTGVTVIADEPVQSLGKI